MSAFEVVRLTRFVLTITLIGKVAAISELVAHVAAQQTPPRVVVFVPDRLLRAQEVRTTRFRPTVVFVRLVSTVRHAVAPLVLGNTVRSVVYVQTRSTPVRWKVRVAGVCTGALV